MSISFSFLTYKGAPVKTDCWDACFLIALIFCIYNLALQIDRLQILEYIKKKKEESVYKYSNL